MNDLKIEHGNRFSSVVLKNSEADIWCEICKFEGNNREEMANQIFKSIDRALHYEKNIKSKGVLLMNDLETKIHNLKIEDNSVLVVKVGSDNRPAREKDLEDMQNAFKKCLTDKFPNLPVIITHHNVDLDLQKNKK